MTLVFVYSFYDYHLFTIILVSPSFTFLKFK